MNEMNQMNRMNHMNGMNRMSHMNGMNEMNHMNQMNGMNHMKGMSEMNHTHMTPEKQDETLELRKHWSADSTPARNEVIMKRTYPVKSVKCNKICSNY